MCMGSKPEAPEPVVVPESVKRVSEDQRRVVDSNNAQAAAAQSATNKTQNMFANMGVGNRKTLLGV